MSETMKAGKSVDDSLSDREWLASEFLRIAGMAALVPELIAALHAVRDYGSRGELDDGTSVSHLVEEALRKAGAL